MSAAEDILGVLACVQEYISDEVTYTRGETVSDPITATQQASAYDIDTGQGVYETVSVIDWVIELSDLAAFGKPEHRDIITRGSQRFEVLGLTGMAQFEYVDSLQLIVAIHTKEISAA